MIIVLTSPTTYTNEITILHRLFEEGLEFLQIYKPHTTPFHLKKLYKELFSLYPEKISIHTDFLKFHSINELKQYQKSFEFAFLSPIFDSISKTGYKSNFNLIEIKEYFNDNPGKKVIALGGIDEDKIPIIKNIGFYGIGILGALWNDKDPIEKFKRIKNKWEQTILIPTH